MWSLGVGAPEDTKGRVSPVAAEWVLGGAVYSGAIVLGAEVDGRGAVARGAGGV